MSFIVIFENRLWILMKYVHIKQDFCVKQPLFKSLFFFKIYDPVFFFKKKKNQENDH